MLHFSFSLMPCFLQSYKHFIEDKLLGNVKDVEMNRQNSTTTGYGILIGRNPTQISHLYESPFAFTGKLDKVVIELK
jgi:hypothetical protein